MKGLLLLLALVGCCQQEYLRRYEVTVDDDTTICSTMQNMENGYEVSDCNNGKMYRGVHIVKEVKIKNPKYER